MNKRIIFLSSLMLCFVLISSSANARVKPDWTESEPVRYPNNLYISATGSASDIELAKDRALANLSKIFEAHINEVSTTKSDTYVSLNNMQEMVAKNNHLSQLVRVTTNKIIRGAQIVESWRDEELAVFYALAVLDRKQARNNIMDEINRLDEETITKLEKVKLSTNTLRKIAALDKAISLQEDRLSLHKMLKIINLHGRGYSSEWQLADLQNQLESEFNLLKISAAVDARSTTPELDKILKSSMANSGFPAVDNGDYTLLINLTVNDLGYQQGWYWRRAKLNIELVKSSGQIIEQKEWLLKVSALQQADAESRLMTRVSNKLNADLRSLIIGAASIVY